MRLDGRELAVKGVIAPKGRLLGQSFDAFVLLPFSTFEAAYGSRKTTVVSVKMPDAESIEEGMAKAEEAMRIAHRLRPGEPNDFAVDKADALIAFWKQLTSLLFTAIPAVVAIGIVVGGIVIMNIMLMTVNERTREIFRIRDLVRGRDPRPPWAEAVGALRARPHHAGRHRAARGAAHRDRV